MASDKSLTKRRAGVRRWFDESELARSRPRYDPDIIERICDLIVDQGIPLPQICRDKLVDGAPSLATLYSWQRSDTRIRDAILGAQQAAAHTRWTQMGADIEKDFERAVEIGDKQTMIATEKKWNLLFKHAQFEVTKMLPNIYGDQRERKVEGGVAEQARKDGAIVVEHVLEIPAKSTEAPPQVETEEEEQDDDVATIIDIPAKRRR